MEEKYNSEIPDLEDTRDNSNCYSISNLLNNENMTQENDAFISNTLSSSPANNGLPQNSVSFIYTPAYKFSK